MSKINEQNLTGTSFQQDRTIYTINKHPDLKNSVQLKHINLDSNHKGTINYKKDDAINNLNVGNWKNIIKIGGSGIDNYEMW